MACTTMSVSTAPTSNAAFKEYNGLRRSASGQDLATATGMRRSYSDNHLSYSVNRVRSAISQPKLKSSRSVGIFPFQISSSIIPNTLKSLFDTETTQDNKGDADPKTNKDEPKEVKRTNWVEKMLEIRSQWKNGRAKESVGDDNVTVEDGNVHCDCNEEGCPANYDTEEERSKEDDDEVKDGNQARYNRESFSRLLVKVPWLDINQFSELAFLCNMAYSIPDIKTEELRRYHGLKFVTSSLEKKAKAALYSAQLEQDTARESKSDRIQRRPSVAYRIAASAASYVQSYTDDGVKEVRVEIKDSNPRYKSAAAAQAAASTMTAVVAAGEMKKQEAARELQSLQSSPCEWFVCDDPITCTRCFVIQGSDSLASWQANLFFEPTKFEGTDVLVHRGIYEVAKGIYEQFMPEIVEHLKSHGDRAKFQFTGHSLGGSLSLLVNLMLLTRKVLKPSSLRPVVTFGSPFVFCQGQKVLEDLGLDESHVHCVMMHRDIVPRAFSCNYPNHVASVLKRLNAAFRSHPCLNKNKLLYSPLGKVFILQPSEDSSPSHPLLPPGNAFYSLDKTKEGYSAGALSSFLNCPHPLETLSDPKAYGSEGSILRDHDSSNYVKAVNGVLRQHTKLVVRKVRRQRHNLLPTLTSQSPGVWNHDMNSASSRKEIMTGV